MTMIVRAAFGLIVLSVSPMLASTWVASAEERLVELEAADSAPAVAVAQAADSEYCNANLKRVLRRVLLSCGLGGGEGARGCQPIEAKNVATMAGDDFNALFLPLSERASVIQFDKNGAELDPRDIEVLEKTFADQQGASWFFVVARSSSDGAVAHNRTLSQQRAETVMNHLRAKFADPDLDKEVGLLWLGEEFAQLDQTFCNWNRSGSAEECKPEHINRSAFVAWIDCRL